MKTELILVGKTVNKHFVAAIDDYVSRIGHYMPFATTVIPELKNTKSLTELQQKEREGELILQKIQPTDTVVLLDERGHLQRLFNSSNACDRAMGGNVHVHIYRKCRFHGYRPLYISVPMYREIVHLVNVHHYTLHSAWIEANINFDNNDEA